MAGEICGMVFDRGPMERNQRFVLLAIAERANKQGYAFPYIEDIAKRTLFTREYAGKAVEELVRDGWISKVPHPSNYRSSAFQLNMARLRGEESSSEQTSSEQSSGGIQQGSHVNSVGISCEQSSNPPHPLLGVTVNEPPLNRQIRSSDRSSSGAMDIDREVEAIYSAYPRREAPRAAKPKIKAAIKRLENGEDDLPPMAGDEAANFLLQKTQQYSASLLVTQGERRFIPHPATWYNQSRYLDDPANWNVSGSTVPKTAAANFSASGNQQIAQSSWSDRFEDREIA